MFSPSVSFWTASSKGQFPPPSFLLELSDIQYFPPALEEEEEARGNLN